MFLCIDLRRTERKDEIYTRDGDCFPWAVMAGELTVHQFEEAKDAIAFMKTLEKHVEEYKPPGLPTYHEVLDLLCDKFNIPGSPTINGVIKWIKENYRQPRFCR